VEAGDDNIMESEEVETFQSTTSQETVLREQLLAIQKKFEESEQGRTQERTDMEARMQDIRQKAKDHLRSLQERMQQVVQQRDVRLQELETEKANLTSELARCEASSSKLASEERTECIALRASLEKCEEARADVAAAGQAAATGAEAALRTELQEQESRAAEAEEELSRARQESEARIADVVRKAKEHVKQVQTRLEGSMAEHRELTEKYREVDEAYKQQQEKVMRYKQLMAQANSRIEESDERVRDLREALDKSQTQRMLLQEQVGSMEKSFNVPPSREEIAQRGGILVAVETENDDVWCLVSNGGAEANSGNSGEPQADAAARSHWWLLSQLDVSDKPIPLQRRWKGEVSALRAQMQRFKKKCEDLQEEFESYKQKANAALKTGAAHSEEVQVKCRQVEQLGEQLQATSLDLQQTRAERAKALEELNELRRRLQEASSKRAELEKTLEHVVSEGEERCATAVHSCRRSFEAEKDALQLKWGEKERAYQQDRDLWRAQKEDLDEEVESLRARLVQRASMAVASPGADEEASPVKPGEDVTDALSRGEPESPLDLGDPPDRETANRAEKEPSASDNARSPRSSPRSTALEPELSAEGPSSAQQALPQQAYSLHASVAWQDLVSLRSQVRQLELSLHEEKQLHRATQRESEDGKAQIREMTMQQRLQHTVEQHQQMEYIRNVFRKFVETLPTGNAEHEQLIPVLMTFFKFCAEDTRAIQGKRAQAKSHGGLWSQLTGRGG